MNDDGSRTFPLLDIERAAQAIAELHAWLLGEEFLGLERYPWPGHLPSLYHDPGILYRFLRGTSNCWQGSALSSAYYTWLATTKPGLWTLCQTFMLCEPVECARLETRLGTARCRRLREAGIFAAEGGVYRSLARVTPLQGRLLWHDAPPGFRESWVFLGADSLEFVRQLAPWAGRAGVRYGRVLDVCTGAGIHALMFSGMADHVVGADINPRAIAFARLNAEMNDVANVSFRLSNLFDGVPDGRFDLVVSNTPFVFLPDELRPRCVDGDGGVMGIELALRLVEGLAVRLEPDGTAILHANSPVVEGRDLLMEGLRARLGGGAWRVSLIPTHEFHDAAFYGLYVAHKIQRFVRYVVVLQAGQPFHLERPALSPLRKAACTLRIAAVHAQGVRAGNRPSSQRASVSVRSESGNG